MEYVGFTPEKIELSDEQLKVIGYLAENGPEHVVTGRWAVFGITQIIKPTPNVDVMIHESQAEKFCITLRKYEKEHEKPAEIRNVDGGMRNVHADVGNVKVDAIILYSQCCHDKVLERAPKENEKTYDTEHVIFETPYHTPFTPVKLSLLYGVDVKIEDTPFSALNPETLRRSKMTSIEKITKEILKLSENERKTRHERNVKRDLEDIELLTPFVDERVIKDMDRFT